MSCNAGQISPVCAVAMETDIMFANPVKEVGVGRPLTALYFTFLSYWRNGREQNLYRRRW